MIKKIDNTKYPKQSLLILLGITLFLQATTSLIGGLLFLSPFAPKEITDLALRSVFDNTSTIYISILLNMITAIVIIVLGIAMYKLSTHINKTLGLIALSFYLLEATMLALNQVFVFGLTRISDLYVESSSLYLLDLGNLCVSSKEFIGQMAMIPFGLGAIIFYYLMMKAEIFPKWLAFWALITLPFILIGIPLLAFGFEVPFFFFAPYVPFEFFAGIYVFVRALTHKK